MPDTYTRYLSFHPLCILTVYALSIYRMLRTLIQFWLTFGVTTRIVEVICLSSALFFGSHFLLRLWLYFEVNIFSQNIMIRCSYWICSCMCLWIRLNSCFNGSPASLSQKLNRYSTLALSCPTEAKIFVVQMKWWPV